MRDALGNVQSVLVFGGGTDVALATVRRLVAARTRTVVLAADRPDQLTAVPAELRAAGATRVEVVPFAAEDTSAHAALVGDLFDRHGDFDVVLVASGPASGTTSVAALAADRLVAQGHGTIVALSPVAGERARHPHLGSGSTTGATDAFLQGLGDSLRDTGVHVVVVRPGFVHPTTAGRRPPPLATTVDGVAEAIVDGLAQGKETIWIPSVLRYVAAGLRHLPPSVSRRLQP